MTLRYIATCAEQDVRHKKSSYRLNDNCLIYLFFGAPGTIRTCDRLVRSQVLYPAELRALKQLIILTFELVCNNFYGGERGIRTLDRGKPIRP